MRILYRVYQLFIAAPLAIVTTVVTAIVTIVGCTIANGHFWGYYPGKLWARIMLALFLIPVHVEGRDNLEKDKSYVFVANHQGAFDIFLIYGYLNRNFKWMMKWQLGRIPFVGYACRKAHHIFVDRRGTAAVRRTYQQASAVLSSGMSMVVFPEGSRTFTGDMNPFKKGAFTLADELQWQVVPLTINGSFQVMPRTRDMHFVIRHPLSLTIHKPIPPKCKGPQNVQATMRESYDVIKSALNK